MSDTIIIRTLTAETKWTTQRHTGYNVCTLYVNGDKVARCNGGGYDMTGTCFGTYIANTFPELLRTKITKPFYGLAFIDPNYNPGTATAKTVAELEATGESLGLERYQAAHSATSPLPTANHTVPSLDGACGMESMTPVFEAIGGKIEWVKDKPRDRGTVYRITLPPETN